MTFRLMVPTLLGLTVGVLGGRWNNVWIGLFFLQFGLDLWSSISYYTMPRLILINLFVVSATSSFLSGPKHFRFHSIWTVHKDFRVLVASTWWSRWVYGTPMFHFVRGGILVALVMFNGILIIGGQNLRIFKML